MKQFKKIAVTVFYSMLVCLAFFVVYKSYSHFYKSLYPVKYENYVEQAAKKYNVDEALIYAVIHTESGFNADAQSQAGARGLMQIMPTTYTWLQTHLPSEDGSVENLLEPETNIEYGVYMLSFLMEHYENKRTALCAYNAGMGNVDKWLKDSELSYDGKTISVIPYPETSQYAERVLSAEKMYNKLYFN
ncbi:MAG: lytic transglycosylase domain-containing protein [Acutalibacteraceae bacterium]